MRVGFGDHFVADDVQHRTACKRQCEGQDRRSDRHGKKSDQRTHDFHKTRAITDGEREISIAQEQSVYTFIYKLQEEVHRFALTSSQKEKRRTIKHSTLERIEGIGPAKARRLLAAMPLGELRRADEATLAAIRGISEADAKAIYAYFHKA